MQDYGTFISMFPYVDLWIEKILTAQNIQLFYRYDVFLLYGILNHKLIIY